MKIYIKELKENVLELEREINEYDDIELNIYNEIKNLSIDWNDVYTSSFLNEIKKEQIKVNELIELLRNYHSIYNYIINNFIKYAQKININLNSKQTVLSKLKKYIYKSNNILNKYYNLNTNSCPSERRIINYQITELKDNKKTIDKLTEYINKLYNDINDLEKTIQNKLIKLEYVAINENDYNSLEKNESNSKEGVNIEIENTINIIISYIDSETSIITNISNTFNELNNYYISTNSNKIENIQNELKKSFEILRNNHNNVIRFITKRSNNYIEATKKAKTEAKKII